MIHVNMTERALVDSKTGAVYRPQCWDALVVYYSYLCSKGHEAMAQQILERVCDGEKVITKMIENMQKHGLTV